MYLLLASKSIINGPSSRMVKLCLVDVVMVQNDVHS
jgi:hypothetical protein